MIRLEEVNPTARRHILRGIMLIESSKIRDLNDNHHLELGDYGTCIFVGFGGEEVTPANFDLLQLCATHTKDTGDLTKFSLLEVRLPINGITECLAVYPHPETGDLCCVSDLEPKSFFRDFTTSKDPVAKGMLFVGVDRLRHYDIQALYSIKSVRSDIYKLTPTHLKCIENRETPYLLGGKGACYVRYGAGLCNENGISLTLNQMRELTCSCDAFVSPVDPYINVRDALQYMIPLNRFPKQFIPLLNPENKDVMQELSMYTWQDIACIGSPKEYKKSDYINWIQNGPLVTVEELRAYLL